MTQTRSHGTITTAIQHQIATIEFAHPASNSFERTQLDALTHSFQELSNNPNVSVIVLQSQGTGAFCAGASFKELLAVTTPEQGRNFFSGFAHLIQAMRDCPKIILGRIHGKAVGGGVGIIAACDYTLATTNASIKLSELAIGIGPFVIEPAVSHKIGKTAMAAMTLEPDQWQSPQWAHQKGLYTQLHQDQPSLDQAVAERAAKLASYNPEALTQLKKILWHNTPNWEQLMLERATISGQLVLSQHTKTALEQFKK
ncbi:enoyl-CoA hydratase/isomerase family protein [Flavobacterium crassostreae]|uniref:Enoyl-CoA hydratase n=1 Tax=Flavobacterium crassostreae TaxID=1763534 RepID=A0A1B9E5Z6_9FLAO|nr:enoyl-CoA hydratase/isomerase family protein [Flavobacterium crassostreae]OCB77357.1 enoyl-CoA hydratase [Flavobacterium crassostreae]